MHSGGCIDYVEGKCYGKEGHCWWCYQHELTNIENDVVKILDNAEKKYLSNVIRPFKEDIISISKVQLFDRKFIYIHLTDDSFSLPYLKSDSMYKGMELDKQYTVKELGLDDSSKVQLPKLLDEYNSEWDINRKVNEIILYLKSKEGDK